MDYQYEHMKACKLPVAMNLQTLIQVTCACNKGPCAHYCTADEAD